MTPFVAFMVGFLVVLGVLVLVIGGTALLVRHDTPRPDLTWFALGCMTAAVASAIAFTAALGRFVTK